jgi:hypothetical protein
MDKQFKLSVHFLPTVIMTFFCKDTPLGYAPGAVNIDMINHKCMLSLLIFTCGAIYNNLSQNIVL